MTDTARRPPTPAGTRARTAAQAGAADPHADPHADPTEPFDVCGPLPTGTTVLEASAGTGKTFTIAALAARYVAEGVAELAELMLVTFSRAATQELRERVRQRLASAERGLADPAAARADPDDDVLRLLASAPDGEVAARRRRLQAALAGFDAATIATTHGFCQQMLAGLGTAGDRDPASTFVEDVDDLVREVADDCYLRSYAASPDPPPLTPTEARRVARVAVQDAQAALVPADAPPGSPAAARVALARAVRAEVARRKRDRRLLDYDDLLTRLRDALADPDRGPAARQRLRERYRVVLVDEFQDTDPVQWEILLAAFHGHVTLVLIGDPKQAVYAFRGADLVTYLRAAASAGTQRTLGTNWRSDAGLVTALDAVLGGRSLGDAGVLVRRVEARHRTARLTGAPSSAPLRVRALRRPAGESGFAPVADVRSAVALDVAAEVLALLRSGARLAGRDDPVGPGDVAILVRTNDQAVLVRDALDARRIPVVLTGARSVFATTPAAEWLTLLRAVEQPHRTGLVRAAALTSFVGWSAAELDAAGEEGVEQLATTLRGWREVLERRGVAALAQVVTATQRLTERLLARPTGERDLTDVRHVAEALHAAATEGQLGPSSLVEWLARRVADSATDGLDERSRRLETDAAAVQVVTIHSAKGLEFPVVLVPYAWNRRKGADPDPLRLHADGGTAGTGDTDGRDGPDGQRLLDVGGPSGPGYRERLRRHWAEDDGEELRLLYVALTRARCQAVAWWAPTRNTESSPLHRVLFGDADVDGVLPPVARVPDDAAVRRRLDALAARCSEVGVEHVSYDDLREAAPVEPWSPPVRPITVLDAGRFDRLLDSAWRRTSYSSLTATLHTGAADAVDAGAVGSEPEHPERDDEPDGIVVTSTTTPDDAERALRSVPLPMAAHPAGTAFGTVVHAALEAVDTSAPDLDAEVARAVDEALGRRPLEVDAGALAADLATALRTPLGPLAGGRTLAAIPPGDRLAELDFELPLAGGDHPSAAGAGLGAVASLVRSHLPPDDPLAPIADRIAALPAERLRGYLTGSIDAVLRVRDGSTARYLVVDYKTNLLGAGAELTAWDYRPAVLARSMVASGYPLQALLYAAALHRFLRWRLPAYDPETHLGGVLYCYVRGMVGPQTPVVDGVPCGVVSWRPPAALVVGLSDLLAGSRS